MKKIILSLLTVASPVQAEQLVIGSPGDYPPFFFKDGQGEKQGIEADLLRDICQRENFDCVFIEMPIANLIAAVAAGKIDLGVGGIGYSEERDAVIDFTCPYMIFNGYSGAFMTRLPDFSAQTGSIAVTADTLYEKVLKKAGIAFTAVESDAEGLQAAMTGKVGAYFGSDKSMKTVQGAEDALHIGDSLPMPDNGTAFLVSESAPDLRSRLNNILATLSSEGRIAQAQRQWFNEDQGDVISTCADFKIVS